MIRYLVLVALLVAPASAGQFSTFSLEGKVAKVVHRATYVGFDGPCADPELVDVNLIINSRATLWRRPEPFEVFCFPRFDGDRLPCQCDKARRGDRVRVHGQPRAWGSRADAQQLEAMDVLGLARVIYLQVESFEVRP